ncbi:MAG: sulfurtransferase-like selenium metabolism protein YedF [Oscillospiraceae bacterium]
MAHVVVNAVGDACPLPVVKATQAIREMKEAGQLEVRVDNETAVQNLTRLAKQKGFAVRSEKKEEKLYTVTMDVTVGAAESEEAACCAGDPNENIVVVCASDAMGHGDDKLGRALMKGCIFAISQLEKLPKAMLFYNGGARLTCEGSDSLEDLKGLEAKGVEILTCGTCLNFYELTDKLAVGSVTNMYTIVEKLAGASKVIKP